MLIPFCSIFSEFSKSHQSLGATKVLHALIAKTHLSLDPYYSTRLLRFYAKNGDLDSAHHLFEQTPQRSIYLWNSIIRSYAIAFHFSDTLELYNRLRRNREMKPDNFTFACVSRACSDMYNVKALRILHASIVVSGLGLDSICCSALVSAYSKLNHVGQAWSVFCGILEPDLVLWNSIISGYGSSENPSKGIELFNRMRKLGLCPDGYTVVGLATGLADLKFVEVGKSIHGFCSKCGFDYNNHVNSVLLSMYSRFKCMDSAVSLFFNLSKPDLVAWSALITGFSQSEQPVMSLNFFRKMNMEGRKADHVLLASTLAASGQIANLRPGCEIHGYAIRHGLHHPVVVSCALIDMYAKCGLLESAMKLFKITPEKNIVLYNSVVSSLGLHGFADEAIQLFEEVLKQGFRPDANTFAAVLGACCHSGLVDTGKEYFRKMIHEFRISPVTEHYVYLVKLLGMAGELKEAYELIQSLPGLVDPGIRGALLSCCSAHGNSELAEMVADDLSKSKQFKSSYGVMLCNVYAGDGRWDDVQKMRVDSNSLKRKVPGISWIGAAKSLNMQSPDIYNHPW